MERIKKPTFDRIYALQIASLVASKGSFSACSKHMGITASNVTKEVQKLEKHLGVKLFKRTTRSLSLTEEGRIVLEKSKPLINSFLALEDEIHGQKIEVRGTLRVTAPTTLGQFYLAPLFALFQKENPYIDIDLRLTDRILDPVEQGVDLSIRTAFELKDSSLYVKKLKPLKRVIVASEDYLQKFSAPRRPVDLHKHNCLLYMRGASPFVWSFRKANQVLNINVTGTYRSNNLVSLITACENSLGILNLPEYLVERQIKKGNLKVVMRSWKLPEHTIYLLSTLKPSQSSRLNKLVKFLKMHL